MLQASQGHQLIQTSNGQHILVQAAIQQQQTPNASSAQQNSSAAPASNGQPAQSGASNGSGQPTQQTAIQVCLENETIKKGFFLLFSMQNNWQTMKNFVDQSLYIFFIYNGNQMNMNNRHLIQNLKGRLVFLKYKALVSLQLSL